MNPAHEPSERDLQRLDDYAGDLWADPHAQDRAEAAEYQATMTYLNAPLQPGEHARLAQPMRPRGPALHWEDSPTSAPGLYDRGTRSHWARARSRDRRRWRTAR